MSDECVQEIGYKKSAYHHSWLKNQAIKRCWNDVCMDCEHGCAAYSLSPDESLLSFFLDASLDWALLAVGLEIEQKGFVLSHLGSDSSYHSRLNYHVCAPLAPLHIWKLNIGRSEFEKANQSAYQLTLHASEEGAA